MIRKILVDAVYPEETRVVICENNHVQEYDYETTAKKLLKGNIYLAKITRVEPSLQAAFIDYGGEKHGFLPFAEIHPNYYNIPVVDRNKSIDDGDDDNDFSLNIPELVLPDLTDDVDAEDIEDNNDESLTTILSQEDNIENDAENEDVNAEDTDIDIDKSDDVEERKEKNNLYHKYRIQEVIKKNQIILVQIDKEERGNKGASCTSYISLAGRYCVLMPNSDRQGGISRRISNSNDRRKLREIVDSLFLPEGTSVIIRTAGIGHRKSEIKRDYDYLVRLWNSIREHTLKAKAPTFIHAESDLIKRIIRDMYDDSIHEVLIQGADAYNKSKDFIKKINLSHAAKIKQYKGKIPLYCKFSIEEQLSSLYNPIAKLESGGYIVINPTEALISIDVNSGRSTSERNIEETALKTNLEAAKEVARQLRLRDLSGLIVIDFIDMVKITNRRIVERSLKDELFRDKARVQVGSISNFGLLEMSRQRLRASFTETNTIKCVSCNGKGNIRSSEANAMMVLRTIENEIYKGGYELINVFAHEDVVIYILNNKSNEIASLQKKYSTKIMFQKEENIAYDVYSIEKVKKINQDVILEPTVTDAEYDMPLIEDEDDAVLELEIATQNIPDNENQEPKKYFKKRSYHYRKKNSYSADHNNQREAKVQKEPKESSDHNKIQKESNGLNHTTDSVNNHKEAGVGKYKHSVNKKFKKKHSINNSVNNLVEEKKSAASVITGFLKKIIS